MPILEKRQRPSIGSSDKCRGSRLSWLAGHVSGRPLSSKSGVICKQMCFALKGQNGDKAAQL